MNRQGAVVLDLLLSAAVGAGALVLQSAITERITALDLLSGAILAACIWLIRQQYAMGGALKGIEERLKHIPTKDEVTNDIAETRHGIRNEFTEKFLEHDNRLRTLERETPI